MKKHAAALLLLAFLIAMPVLGKNPMHVLGADQYETISWVSRLLAEVEQFTGIHIFISYNPNQFEADYDPGDVANAYLNNWFPDYDKAIVICIYIAEGEHQFGFGKTPSLEGLLTDAQVEEIQRVCLDPDDTADARIVKMAQSLTKMIYASDAYADAEKSDLIEGAIKSLDAPKPWDSYPYLLIGLAAALLLVACVVIRIRKR